MIYLLDVSVLIALFDAEHVNCRLARDWFKSLAGGPWATCPLTELGVMRIMGNRSYPGSPGSPAAIKLFLDALIARGGHQFWQDEIDLRDTAAIDASRLLSHAQLTDSYLLALARSRGAMFATLDQRVVLSAIPGGAQHLHVLT